MKCTRNPKHKKSNHKAKPPFRFSKHLDGILYGGLEGRVDGLRKEAEPHVGQQQVVTLIAHKHVHAAVEKKERKREGC